MSRTSNTTLLEQEKKEQDEKSLLLKKEVSFVTEKVYDSRYNTGDNVESQYTNAFTNRKKLVADGEKDVFEKGLKKSKEWMIEKSQNWDNEAKQIYNNQSIKEESEKEKLDNWQNLAKEIIEKLGIKTIKILDFGCGDGRSLELLVEMAKKLETSGITVRALSYDISEEGLKAYEKKLRNPLNNYHNDILREHYGEESYKIKIKAYESSEKNESFLTENDYGILKKSCGDKEVEKLKKSPRFLEMEELGIYNEEVEVNQNSKIRKLKVLKHNNLEIELLKGDPQITSEEWKSEISEVDLSLILYGSTSHIFPEIERNNFIKAILAVTKNQFIATLPGEQNWHKELEEARNDPSLGEGEIKYKSRDTGEELFHAVYSYDLLKKTMNEICEDKNYEILISSKYDPRQISQSFWRDLGNQIQTPITEALKDMVPSSWVKPAYFGVLAEGKAKKNDDKDGSGSSR